MRLAALLALAAAPSLAVAREEREASPPVLTMASEEQSDEGPVSHEEIHEMLAAIKQAEDSGALDDLEATSMVERPELAGIDEEELEEEEEEQEPALAQLSAYERARQHLLGGEPEQAQDPVTTEEEKAFMNRIAEEAEKTMTPGEVQDAEETEEEAEEEVELLPPEEPGLAKPSADEGAGQPEPAQDPVSAEEKKAFLNRIAEEADKTMTPGQVKDAEEAEEEVELLPPKEPVLAQLSAYERAGHPEPAQDPVSTKEQTAFMDRIAEEADKTMTPEQVKHAEEAEQEAELLHPQEADKTVTPEDVQDAEEAELAEEEADLLPREEP